MIFWRKPKKRDKLFMSTCFERRFIFYFFNFERGGEVLFEVRLLGTSIEGNKKKPTNNRTFLKQHIKLCLLLWLTF